MKYIQKMILIVMLICSFFTVSACSEEKPKFERKEVEAGVYLDESYTNRVENYMENIVTFPYDGEEHPLYIRLEYQGEPIKINAVEPWFSLEYLEHTGSITQIIKRKPKNSGQYIYKYGFDGDTEYLPYYIEIYMYIE